jgi:hypothetical protein
MVKSLVPLPAAHARLSRGQPALSAFRGAHRLLCQTPVEFPRYDEARLIFIFKATVVVAAKIMRTTGDASEHSNCVKNTGFIGLPPSLTSHCSSIQALLSV